jgi:hypothetical protein
MPDFGGGGGSSTSTQTTSPWGPLQQPLQDVIAKAGQLYKAGGFTPQPEPFDRVAGFDPLQLKSQSMGEARAVNGSPLNIAAQGYANDVLGGKYLNSNPYAQQLANQVGSRITNQLSLSGRYGANNATTRGLAEGLAPVLNQNYQTERGYQQQAAAMAPDLANQDYVDINALNTIGTNRQTQAQAQLDDLARRFGIARTADQNALATYLGFLSGNPGSVQTTTAPNTGPSGTQQAIGTGISLLGALASLWGKS